MLLKVFVFLLLVFHKFLEPKMHFTLKIDSDIHDIQTTPLHLMTDMIYMQWVTLLPLNACCSILQFAAITLYQSILKKCLQRIASLT
jgi:hypothetical protein